MKQTSLLGIAKKAASDQTHRFQNLIGLLSVGYLLACWRLINKRAACGVDRQDARAYEQNLEEHVGALVEAVRGGWYRAKLVLRRYIPKLNGKLRPLGIPAIADKVLQMGVTKILEEIYEEDFLACSYGYRPNVGALDAVRDLSAELRSGRYHFLVEADIRSFFDRIDHDKLIDLLKKRIDDEPFLRLIRKWLKAGILETDGRVIHPQTGSPQGGIVSPMLANIYLHYALDVWFEETVKVSCKGKAYLCRYADDFVCAFECESDAERFYRALGERMKSFGLEVAKEKTHLIRFSRQDWQKNGSFEFLGFEFRWGRGRWGKPALKYRTARTKYRAALANFQALFRLVWARGHARLVTLGPRRGPTAAVETWLDGHCQRTPCGQSGDVASDRGGKPGTTLKCFSLLGRDVPRVAPGLPPLIPPLPTLRRARPAAGPGRLRRNNNWLSDCSDTNGLAAYPHQTEQTQLSGMVS